MTYVLTFHRNELIYDIEMITYKVAKTHLADERPEAATAVAATSDDVDFIDRLIESAIANVENELQWCIDRSRHHNTASDSLTPGEREYHIVLQLDDTWKENTHAITTAIHDYIVNDAVFRLLLATMPNLAPAYASLAESYLNTAYNLLRTNLKSFKP